MLAGRPFEAIIENGKYKIVVDERNGSIASFFIKDNASDLIAEKKLMSDFRICLQTANDLSVYIDGMQQEPFSVLLRTF